MKRRKLLKSLSLVPLAGADIAVLNLRQGNFGFWDRKGKKLEGTQKFECELTIRDGRIVYDLNDKANPVVVKR